ncbi:MAG: right-handed parallel beta-helix repeat-containing protein [Lentisphaeria bacterium]|nr:right-handed parallel beta-helix repeat-containing protein [Lentisphaeria bacterium]
MGKYRFFAIVSFFCCVLAGAGEIFVDYNASAPGDGSRKKPFSDFDRAIRKAKPGDTVKILPAGKIIHDTLRFANIRGTADKPIVVDGMFNIFSGVKAIDPAQWQEKSPGLYCRRAKMAEPMRNRFFLVMKGKIVRMGRYTKGRGSAKFKKPETLGPGEWTTCPTPEKNIWEIFVRLPENCASLKDAHIEEPTMKTVSGVIFYGKEGSSHVTVRNVIVRHVWNDGFNFHGPNTHLVLENIAAVECGDDGISAHEANQIFVRNFVAIGNSTGICHIQKADCTHENVYLENNLGLDVEFVQDTRNVLKNAAVSGIAHDGILIGNRTGYMLMENCRFIDRSGKSPFRFPTKTEAKLEVRDVQFSGYRPKNLPESIKKTGEEQLKTAVEEQRKKLFAIFGGQLERALKP